MHVLQDLDGRIDMVIDGGPTTVGIESTVIDLSSPVPTILRPGAVTIEMIREVLPDARMRPMSARDDAGMKSPGLLPRHYSPRAPTTVYEGPARAVVERIAADASRALADGKRVGILAANEDVIVLESTALHVVRLGEEGDEAAHAANLYSALRTLDAEHVDLILARTFAFESGLAAAIHDRLRRAAHRVVQIPGP
jgi:L-threonylcarbamoyladenylate synthase